MKSSKLSGDPEMTNAELALLVSELSSAANASREKAKILEIGTAAGGTLVRMLGAIPREEHGRVGVIDPFNYFEDHLGRFRKNLTDNGYDPGTIDIRVGYSKDELKKSVERGDRFDFILFDASHKLYHTTQELRWMKLLVVGGLAAFHDYKQSKWPGVKIAVDKFLSRNPNYRIKSGADSLLVIEKTAPTTKTEVPLTTLITARIHSIIMRQKRLLLGK